MSLLDLINGLDAQNGRGFDDLNEMLARLRAAKSDESSDDANVGYGMSVKDMPKPPTPDAQSWAPTLEPAQRLETPEPKNFTVPQTAPIVRPNAQAQPPMQQSGPTPMQPQANQNFGLPKPTIAQHLMNIGSGFTGKGAVDLNQQWEMQNQLGQSLVNAGVAPNVVAAAMQQPELMKQLVATKFGPKTTPTFGVIGESPFGQKQYGTIDLTNPDPSQRVQPYNPQSGGQALPSQIDPTLTGEEFLNQLPKGVATQVKAIVEGRLKPPPMGRKNPYWEQLLQYAGQYDPGFDMTKFATRQGLNNSFAYGADAKEITAYNTVMGHLIDAYKDVNALGNTVSPFLNSVYNSVRGQTSPAFQKARSDLESKMDLAIGEVNKAAAGKPITVAEQQYWHSRLGQNSSPTDLHETLKSFTQLIKSRMEAMAEKWNVGQNVKEGDPRYKTVDSLLSKKAKDKYEFLMGNVEGKPPEGAEAPAAPAAPALNLRGVPAKAPEGAPLAPNGRPYIPNPNFDKTKPVSRDNPQYLLDDGKP